MALGHCLQPGTATTRCAATLRVKFLRAPVTGRVTNTDLSHTISSLYAFPLSLELRTEYFQELWKHLVGSGTVGCWLWEISQLWVLLFHATLQTLEQELSPPAVGRGDQSNEEAKALGAC